MSRKCTGFDNTSPKRRQAGRSSINCSRRCSSNLILIRDERQASTKTINKKAPIIGPLQRNLVFNCCSIRHSLCGNNGSDFDLRCLRGSVRPLHRSGRSIPSKYTQHCNFPHYCAHNHKYISRQLSRKASHGEFKGERPAIPKHPGMLLCIVCLRIGGISTVESVDATLSFADDGPSCVQSPWWKWIR